MWLTLRKYEGRLLGNNTILSVIYWILFCGSSVLGYDYSRRYPTPTFSSTSGNVTFFVGATANLSCVVENLGARTIIWRKLPDISPITVGEQLFKQDSRISINHDSSRNNWDLIINDLTFEDSGVYECQVPSLDKNVRQHIVLRVKDAPVEEKTVPPPVISIAAPKLTHVGDILTIECKATYTGVAGIDWFFDGFLLESNFDAGITIKERFSSVSKTIHSTLQISEASMANSGTYTCRSADKYVTEYRLTVLSDVRTNNKKRVISDSTDLEASTSGLTSNTSTRISTSHLVIPFLLVTLFLSVNNGFL